MQKCIIYIILPILLASCISDKADRQIQANNAVIEFTTNIASESTSRATVDQIGELYVMVFDKNGLFITRALAEYTPTTNARGNYKVTLPESHDKRILHFIANYDWSGFDDRAAESKDEKELIPKLKASSSMVFWSRFELDSGISDGCLTGRIVVMLRNMAKFTVDNQDISGNLTNAGFYLFHKPDAGTVSPFDPSSGSFGVVTANPTVLTEPANVSYDKYDSSIIAADGIASSYCYERENSSATSAADNPTFIIVNGKYRGVQCFYKIDVFDIATQKLLDIRRNFWYAVTITRVGGEGYSSLQEALNSPASNNITASVVLQPYPSISDGVYSLTVGSTNMFFMDNDSEFRVTADYVNLSTGLAENNSIVVTTQEQDPGLPVFATLPVYDPANGVITATLNDVVPGTVLSSVITVRAGTLLRTIIVTLREPFQITGLTVTPNTVNPVIGYPVKLSFTIPPEVEDFLPLDIRITATGLSPVSSSIEIVDNEGSWYYVYRVSSTGTYTLDFETNTEQSAEAILVTGDIFSQQCVIYSNSKYPETYNLNGLHIIPQRAPFYPGKEVTLEFVAWSDRNVIMKTDNLEFVDIKGGTVFPTWVLGVPYMTILPHGPGLVSIKFITKELNNGEVFDFQGDISQDKSYHNTKLEWKNQLINLKGRLLSNGKPVAQYYSPMDAIRIWALTNDAKTPLGGAYPSVQTGDFEMLIESKIGNTIILDYNKNQVIDPLLVRDTYIYQNELVYDSFLMTGPETDIGTHDFHAPWN